MHGAISEDVHKYIDKNKEHEENEPHSPEANTTMLSVAGVT